MRRSSMQAKFILNMKSKVKKESSVIKTGRNEVINETEFIDDEKDFII